MASKNKGSLTVSGEWAKHLRKFWKRKFWKAERSAARIMVKKQKDFTISGSPMGFQKTR
jgi:hypothetical protein